VSLYLIISTLGWRSNGSNCGGTAHRTRVHTQSCGSALQRQLHTHVLLSDFGRKRRPRRQIISPNIYLGLAFQYLLTQNQIWRPPELIHEGIPYARRTERLHQQDRCFLSRIMDILQLLVILRAPPKDIHHNIMGLLSVLPCSNYVARLYYGCLFRRQMVIGYQTPVF
jgi:hypothetical protein